MDHEGTTASKPRRGLFRLVVGVLLLPFVAASAWVLFDQWETGRIEKVRARIAELGIATEPERTAPAAADQELLTAVEEFQRSAAAISRREADGDADAAVSRWFVYLEQFNHAHFARDMKSWRGELESVRTVRSTTDYRSVLAAAERFALAARCSERSVPVRTTVTQGSRYHSSVGDKAACLLFAEAMLAFEDGDTDLSRRRQGQAVELAVSGFIRSNLRYLLQLLLERRGGRLLPEETAELSAAMIKLSRPLPEAWRVLLVGELRGTLDGEWERLSRKPTAPADSTFPERLSERVADIVLHFPRPFRKHALCAEFELLAELLAQSSDPNLPTLRDLAVAKTRCGSVSADRLGQVPEFAENLRLEIETRLFEQARARAEAIVFAVAASLAAGTAFSPDSRLGLPQETWTDPTSGSAFQVRLERGEVVVWGAGFDQRNDRGIPLERAVFPEAQARPSDDVVVRFSIPASAAP